MLALLGVEVSQDVHDRLLGSITDPDPASDPHLTPNVAETLVALRERGLRIGIICDVGLAPSTTLRRYLSARGVLGLFDHWSFSDEVGTFKPDPVIFDHALAGLAVASVIVGVDGEAKGIQFSSHVVVTA